MEEIMNSKIGHYRLAELKVGKKVRYMGRNFTVAEMPWDANQNQIDQWVGGGKSQWEIKQGIDQWKGQYNKFTNASWYVSITENPEDSRPTVHTIQVRKLTPVVDSNSCATLLLF